MSIPDPIVLLDARARYVHPAFQMTRASTKTVFDATGKLVTVPANALGWDHDPATGQARGYLAEPSTTNLLLHSNDPSESAWSKNNASITANAITGPDGNGMAKLVEDTTSAQHRVLQTVSISDGDAVVGRCIAKAGERPAVRLLLGDGASTSNYISVVADLDLGVLRSASESGDGLLEGYGVVPIGDGFCLVWVAGTLGAGATSARFQVSLSNADGSVAYEGDGASGVYLGYAQAEPGSRPTSYTQTGGATALRNSDHLALAGLGGFDWWQNKRATFLVDVDILNNAVAGEILNIHGGQARLAVSSRGEVVVSGSLVGSNRGLSLDFVARRHLIALTWGGSEVAAAADGAISFTDSLGSTPSSNPSLGVGAYSSGGSAVHAYFRRVVYYPARISNADLQSLTAIQE